MHVSIILALRLAQQLAAPVRYAERSVGWHIVGLELRMPIVVDVVIVGETPFNTLKHDLHVRPPSAALGLLSIKVELASVPAVFANDLLDFRQRDQPIDRDCRVPFELSDTSTSLFHTVQRTRSWTRRLIGHAELTLCLRRIPASLSRVS